MPEVLLRGDGLAVAACNSLLSRAGWQVFHDLVERPKLPVVLLNQASQKLVRDVFENATALEGLYRIDKRIVRWGNGTQTLTIPHQALAVGEQTLLDRVGSQQLPGGSARYAIHTVKPLPIEHCEAAFGSRRAEAVSIRLRANAARHACWVESVSGGWLFAVSVSDDQAWMLAVGDSSETLLGQSIVVGEIVDSLADGRSEFAAFPRIADPLAGADWLACGGAAISFDPLCGEGTGHALREAILATAILKAHVRGLDWAAMQSLYEQRLRGGMRRHLEQCHQLYSSGGQSEWWLSELASVETGLRRIEREHQWAPAFRLEGFDLVPLKPLEDVFHLQDPV
ncbi:MAG: hypothetical protein NTW74_19490 [Acidobacteria bacterium]|nr:hypothetical protein [Acidobacteriota bacterium]